jgi:hypothetical protein
MYMICNWTLKQGLFEITGISLPQPLENLEFLIVSTVLTVLKTTKLLLYLTKIQGLNCDAVSDPLYVKCFCVLQVYKPSKIEL